jgi:uncharacterized membrane-anchored protein
METIHNFVKEYGQHAFAAAAALSLLFWYIVISRYFKGKEERSGWTKFMDVILMFLYIALFVVYVMVGISIGDSMFSSVPIGFCIGVGAYWLMFEILAFIKKKRTKA